MLRLFHTIVLLAFTCLSAEASPISGARQLIFEGERSGEGYFSADGSKMIFQSERAPGNPFFQIYTLDLETGDVERLSPGIGKTTCGWLHPDGERALYASTQFDPDARAEMEAELAFRASGESRRYNWDYDPDFEIVETRLEGGGYTRIAPARGYDAEGAYSPDGSRIVFASNRHAYASDLDEEAAARLERDPSYFLDIYVMDADGGNLRRLTTSPGYDGGPFWSAVGSKITWRRFSEDGARAEIYTMNADGTGERQITDLDVLSWAPFFHPSGEYLIFSTNLNGFSNFELYIVDADGATEPVRVTDREGFDGLPTFAPDGRTLSWTSNRTPSGNSQIFIADWDHAAALALLGAAPARNAAASPVEGTAPGIETADLRRHVEALTADEMAGRLTGTEGERLATAYVADAFEAIGLAPAGSGGTMFQPFEFTAGVDLAPGNRLTISVDGESRSLEAGEEWTPLAFSRTGEASPGPVAFAGYGIVAPDADGEDAMDSYDGLDVSGKWVLVWRGMPSGLSRERRTELSRFADPRYKVSVAKAHGAKGVIFAPPLDEGFDDGLPRLTYEAISGEAGLPVVAVRRAVAERVLAVLGEDLPGIVETAEAGGAAGRELAGVSATAEVALDFERRSGRNVLGRLELDGVEDGPPPLVIGAHVDHLGRGETSGSLAAEEARDAVHPGADDNASGVAALIEVAQKLAADHAAGRLEAGRDIIFAAWSGEELGLLGATHFVDRLADEAGAEDLADLVSAYLNMDMIGRLEDKVVLSGVGSSDIWPREIERRNAVIGLPIAASDRSHLPTDATPFYLAGVPILSAFTGAHEDYHTPADTPEKLNYEGLRDITRFMALVARSRVQAIEEPAYLEVAAPAGRDARRTSSVFLGTIPDYAAEGQSGVPLSGVVTDGPADEAGMKAGDVLIGLAGEELGNIYDFVRVLNGLRPGETVEVRVLREGTPRSLKVTPTTRD